MNPGDELPPAAPFYESYSRPGSGFQRFHLRAMGTDNFLLLRAEDGSELRRIAQEAFGIFEDCEERLSKFLPESDVSLANQLAASRPVFVGEDFLDLLARAREAWEITGGAFDPTVGPLLSAWGLVDMNGRVPPEAEIRRLLEHRGMDLVETDDSGAVRYLRTGVSVDLGGIGKGYAVDAVVRHLREQGVGAGAVISGRSTVVTWGTPPAAGHWRVQVVDPDAPHRGLCTLLVQPGAVSSSGAYERRFRLGGEEYGHVLDPRSGQPVDLLRSATVWTRTALLGDVLSTTLFVLGPEALGRNGCAERLAQAWTPPGEEPRASFLWVESSPSGPAGRDVKTHHIGEPAFSIASADEDP